jgi:hypothetical protein
VDELPRTTDGGVAVKEATTGTDVPPLLQAAMVRAASPAIQSRRSNRLKERCIGCSLSLSLLENSLARPMERMIRRLREIPQGIHGK